MQQKDSIKPSASILLVRDSENGLEVLMTERAGTMAFAPGALVFPGGKLDKADYDPALWRGLVNGDPEDIEDDFPYKLASLRELYEETAILLTTALCGANASGLPFHQALCESQGLLDIAGLVFFAHWVTPEGMPRRFETRFYLAPYNGDTYAHDRQEAVSMHWLKPRDILEQKGVSAAFPLMFPTRMTLIKLARAATVKEAFAEARATPVVRVTPKLTDNRKAVTITVEEEASFTDVRSKSAFPI